MWRNLVVEIVRIVKDPSSEFYLLETKIIIIIIIFNIFAHRKMKKNSIEFKSWLFLILLRRVNITENHNNAHCDINILNFFFYVTKNLNLPIVTQISQFVFLIKNLEFILVRQIYHRWN